MHSSRLANATGTSVVPGTSPIRTQHTTSSRRSAVRVAAAAAATSNPVGVHALVFSGDWSEAGARAAAAGAAAAGYDLVEIAAFNAGRLDADMTRRVFEEHGVQAACSLGLTLDADISSDSEEVSSKLLHLRWPGWLRSPNVRWVCCCTAAPCHTHTGCCPRGSRPGCSAHLCSCHRRQTPCRDPLLSPGKVSGTPDRPRAGQQRQGGPQAGSQGG